MGVVALMDPGARLAVHGGALQIERGGVVIRAVPTHEVREVQIFGGADLTPAARGLLLREGIDVIFLTRDGRYRGRLSSAESRAGRRRLRQYALALDPARRLALARSIVAGKVANQRALLLRRQEALRDERVAGVLAALRASRARIGEAADLDALRGHEGYAARLYFSGLSAAVVNANFAFEGRNMHPPRDPVNALLSFGYTLLLTAVEGAVRVAGLDPYVGFLHDDGRGGASLAFDLMEEARPAVDGVVLGLVNRRQVSPEDFRTPPAEELGAKGELAERAVYLGKVAKQILLRAWEDRLSRPEAHPVRGDRWPLRDLLREQSAQVARIADGEATEYVPLALRG